MALKKYCYYSGDEIQVGDIVLYPEVGKGVVERIFMPHSREALRWNLPEGGVFFRFDRESALSFFGETNDEEDLELICRGNDNQKEKG